VTIPAGTYRFGPDDATLSIRTGRTGAAAKAGHDLLLHVTAWEGTVTATEIELSADGGSLRVQEGTGGIQALGDDDKTDIAKTIDDEVLKRQPITFRSTALRPADGGVTVEGDLTLLGATRPVTAQVTIAADGALGATATIRQTDFGMKPYSTLFGALKVADEVVVSLVGTLGPGPFVPTA
jgi:YceI-like domain